jgi:hypothetical protein
MPKDELSGAKDLGDRVYEMIKQFSDENYRELDGILVVAVKSDSSAVGSVIAAPNNNGDGMRMIIDMVFNMLSPHYGERALARGKITVGDSSKRQVTNWIVQDLLP